MFEINLKSNDPIYKQIVDSTRENLMKGILREGDKLPSVRELAKILLVNESTVQRAYREMESLGIIKTVVGRGTFIEFDESRELLEKENTKIKLKEVLKEAIYHGFSAEDVKKFYDEVSAEVKNA